LALGCVGPALLSLGCLSQVPLDVSPWQPIDKKLLGSWQCRAIERSERKTATLDVSQASPNTYALVWREEEKDPDHYPAFASRLGDAVVMNIRLQPALEGAKETVGRPWTFGRYSFDAKGRLRLELITQRALRDVAQTQAAMRDAVTRAAHTPDTFFEFCACTRLHE
jgi:hypothetical protein